MDGKRVIAVWWMRRRRAPLWLWVLAALGLKSMWRWRTAGASPEWQDKRRRFNEKIEEAFKVWKEPESGTTDSDPSEGNTSS
jgi:hypothetical protein